MKKEITLEMIEAQLAVVFRKLVELEELSTGKGTVVADKGLYYLEKLRSEAETVIKSSESKG